MVDNNDKNSLASPSKEAFTHIEPSEFTLHAELAKNLIPISTPTEAVFLEAYALELSGIKAPVTDKKKGDRRLAVADIGAQAAQKRLPVTSAIRFLEKFLAASYRGQSRSDKKVKALGKNALIKPRAKAANPRCIRQPLTVSADELALIKEAANLSGKELPDYIRDGVMAVATGEAQFNAPRIFNVGGRNSKYQVRWSEAEWSAVKQKAEELYGATTGIRGRTGVMIRDVTIHNAENSKWP